MNIWREPVSPLSPPLLARHMTTRKAVTNDCHKGVEPYSRSARRKFVLLSIYTVGAKYAQVLASSHEFSRCRRAGAKGLILPQS
jgi:hypothetical protein